MDDDLPPDLEDFQEVIDKINPDLKQKKNESSGYTGDYTKTTDEINEEIAKKLKIQQEITKKEQAKKEEEQKKVEQPKPKKKEDSGFGFKKGFLSGGGDKPKKQKPKEEIIELKIDEKQQQKNKLEIPEVQQAMKMNDYLTQTQKDWMTPELLMEISKNPKLQKAFSNPEYMNVSYFDKKIFQQAITQMQKNPKQVLEKYGKNPEFMMIMQEFTKIMGNHFQDISEKEKQTQQQQNIQSQQQQNMDKEQQELQKRLQDPEVQQILQDPKVKAFFEYLQKNKGADFHQIMQRDPQLGVKLNVLIKKGVINLQQSI